MRRQSHFVDSPSKQRIHKSLARIVGSLMNGTVEKMAFKSKLREIMWEIKKEAMAKLQEMMWNGN